MSDLENNFSIYPYGYEDELAKKRVAADLDEQRTYLSEKIGRPADATARGIGDLAIQSLTGGLLQPTFDTEIRRREITPALSRQLGRPLVRELISIDRSLLSSPIRTGQMTTVNERAILGYGERQAA